MKKIVLLSLLIIVFSSLPVAATQDKMAAGEATDKLQKKETAPKNGWNMSVCHLL